MRSMKEFSRIRRARKIIGKILSEKWNISEIEYRKLRKDKIIKMNAYFSEHPRLKKNSVSKSNVMRDVVIGGMKICEFPYAE